MKKCIILSLAISFSIVFFSCSDQKITADGYLSDEQIVDLENRLHNGETITIPSKYSYNIPSGKIKLRSK